MKIRKILLLVLLAAGSVFLLSSCDALLDAIFANNTVTVYVSAYIPTWCIYSYPFYLLTSSTDKVPVTINGPKNVSTYASYSGNDGSYMYWTLVVPQLSDGLYSVNVQYLHPFGLNAPYTSPVQTQFVTLPSGEGNNVNLSFGF